MKKQFALALLCMALITACRAAVYAGPTTLLAPSYTPATPAGTDLPTIALQPPGTTTTTSFPTIIVPTLTPYPDDEFFSLGKSVEGRDILAWQFGEGPTLIVLVGGIHGGFEGNTVVLLEQLVNHFRLNPDKVLPGIRMVLIPVANPDGLVRGADLDGRFNARGVDLNRNWGCEWEDTAYLREEAVDPGPRPFSEPETLALRAFFVAQPPSAVIFYHSAAGGIFLGACRDGKPANWMGELLSEATGYPNPESFSYYEVTGDATNWLAERGVPAAVVETYTQDDPDFEINLAGVMALQCHFALENYSDLESGTALPDPIRRFCVP